MASPISRVSGGYPEEVAVVEDSEAEPTMGKLLELAAQGVDKAHKALPHRRPVEDNAAAWFRLFLPTEFRSQRLEMPV
jgi:hypothetical protein